MIKTINQSSFLKITKINNNFDFTFQTLETKRTFSEEFKSLGFYISNHPLNEYEEYLSQLRIILMINFIIMKE